MLQRILLLTLVLILPQTVSAQSCVDSQNKWLIERFGTNENGNSVYFTYQYSFDSLVVIDDMEYHCLAGVADSIEDRYALEEAGKFFREDNGTVYYRDSLDGPEYHLFDMSAEVDDTY